MMPGPEMQNIRRALKDWYAVHKRDLPWRNTRDPYVIWLSEIILQQTRVDQGMPYFMNFLKHFPDVHALARAPHDRIKKLWEGLGYYRRAENLHKTAKIVVNQHDGKFPGTYKELLKLPGIGPYTAAAIASFAYDEPVAVTDGNVYRVLSRIFHIDTAINSSAGKKLFARVAGEFLDRSNPALHNQSIMEFGALQCVPKNPGCENCPVKNYCAAYANDAVERLPVKIPRKASRKRFFYYLISMTPRGVAVRKRQNNDIWHGLYEFPGFESAGPLSEREVMDKFRKKFHIRSGTLRHVQTVKHQLTHQDLQLNFWLTGSVVQDGRYFDYDSLQKMAFPVVLRRILDDMINIPNFDT